MPNRVKLELQAFENAEKATEVADRIRETGFVSYTDASGSTVNVTVGDVTVES